MKHTMLLIGGISALVVSVVGGCYSYPPPPAATEGDLFTNRKTDQSDEILKDIKQLTLRQAQHLSLYIRTGLNSTHGKADRKKGNSGSHGPEMMVYFCC